MTELQLLSRQEQVEAMRRDFVAEWAPRIRVAKLSGIIDRKLFEEMDNAWKQRLAAQPNPYKY